MTIISDIKFNKDKSHTKSFVLWFWSTVRIAEAEPLNAREMYTALSGIPYFYRNVCIPRREQTLSESDVGEGVLWRIRGKFKYR